MDWRLRMRLSWSVLCPVVTWECFEGWMRTQFSAKVCKGRYTLSDKFQQPVVATRRIDKSVHMYWRISVKIFVSSTEFCRSNMSQKIKSENLCDSTRQQILLQRQRFSQKFPSTHEAICRCDVSPQRVAATTNCSRPTLIANESTNSLPKAVPQCNSTTRRTSLSQNQIEHTI